MARYSRVSDITSLPNVPFMVLRRLAYNARLCFCHPRFLINYPSVPFFQKQMQIVILSSVPLYKNHQKKGLRLLCIENTNGTFLEKVPLIIKLETTVLEGHQASSIHLGVLL